MMNKMGFGVPSFAVFSSLFFNVKLLSFISSVLYKALVSDDEMSRISKLSDE